MSFFNDANEMASVAVWGKHYIQHDLDEEPCGRPTGITEHDGVLRGELRAWGAVIDLTGKPVNHKTWAALAMELEAYLTGHGIKLSDLFKEGR